MAPLPRILRFCVISLLFFSIGEQARAEDILISTLILAKREIRSKADSDLRPYTQDILQIFKYNNLKLLAYKERVIKEYSEGTLKSSQLFYLRYNVLKRLRAHYQIHIDLLTYSDMKERLLASTEVRIAKKAPIYIKGPLWHSGNLILILEIK